LALHESLAEFVDDQSKVEGPRRKGMKKPTTPYPDIIRAQRRPTHGLLLLYFVDPEKSWNMALQDPATGFGVSFPASKDEDCGIEYLANRVHQWEAGLD
jgi:hypothetical protein